SVLGQTLTGDVTIARTVDSTGAPQIQLGLDNLVLKLGGDAANPILTVTQTAAHGSFTISSQGIVGQIGVTLAANIPGLSLPTPTSHTFNLELNTTQQNGGPFVRVDPTIDVTILGQTITGTFVFEQTNIPG